MTERVLFVHAHPDDESISTGATIATLIDRGASVTVLTLTRGERGEVIPDELQHLVDAPEQLGSAREAEPVSYTHLDVYKRQPRTCAASSSV